MRLKRILQGHKRTQPVIMSTGSGFWPSHGWLSRDWWPYLERCKKARRKPMEYEAYYRATMRGGIGDPRETFVDGKYVPAEKRRHAPATTIEKTVAELHGLMR